jgi:hypothetical protein
VPLDDFEAVHGDVLAHMPQATNKLGKSKLEIMIEPLCLFALRKTRRHAPRNDKNVEIAA